MLAGLSWRLLKEVSPKILWKTAYNFCYKNMLNMHAFERRWNNGQPFFPAFMILSLTSKCNLSCQGCWVAPEKEQQLPLTLVSNIIEQCRAKGSYYFGLVGGEPLLYPHLFRLLKRYPDCYFQLFTNGTYLTGSVARKIRKLGNVTPLLSIEGLAEVSDSRRGGKKVYNAAIKALQNCKKARLFTGVAASICQSNFAELVNRKFVRDMIKRGAHYLWYYIYRPVGPRPHPELALRREQILELRRFIVDTRLSEPIAIIDAYWDAAGNAVCPGAMGLSHHVSPEGHLEFCPPLQMACEKLDDGRDFTEKIQNSRFLADLRQRVSRQTRGCILLNDPQLLHRWLKDELHADDSSGRSSAYAELERMQVVVCHHLPGHEIPEKSWLYRLAKKYYFFGFGAYG
ncbi:radical SAM protein [Candidatus Riflebacteria bacterium]